MGGSKKSTSVYQHAQNCNQILAYMKSTGLDPFISQTYSKIIQLPKFAGFFSATEKVEDVRKYFVAIVKSTQKTERLKVLNSLPELDMGSFRKNIENITLTKAIENPNILNALSHYEKDTKHNLFGLRVPDNIEARKEFIHCKNNLLTFRKYLYVEHDILVTKTIELINALYAIYVFKISLSSLNISNKRKLANNETLEKPQKQEKIFQIGTNAIKFHLLHQGVAQHMEALHLKSLIQANGGVCVENSKEAHKIILVGQANEWETETIASHCSSLFTTGLIWQAIGSEKYDLSKDVQFVVKKPNLKQQPQYTFDSPQTIELSSLAVSHNIKLGPARKKAKILSDDKQVETGGWEPENVLTSNLGKVEIALKEPKVFDGEEFYVFCSKKGEVDTRNQILKLIRENGGLLRNGKSDSTINILVGPFTHEWAQKSSQEQFVCYDPLVITDTVAIGTFVKEDLEVYKYTDEDIVDTINTPAKQDQKGNTTNHESPCANVTAKAIKTANTEVTLFVVGKPTCDIEDGPVVKETDETTEEPFYMANPTNLSPESTATSVLNHTSYAYNASQMIDSISLIPEVNSDEVLEDKKVFYVAGNESN